MKIKINLFKKPKLPITLFIAASLAALVLLPIFFLSLKSMLSVRKENNTPRNNYLPYGEKKEYDTSDPFITKVPQLKDIITKPIVNGDDPAIGNENAPITIVEFSDFECEFCQKQERILKQTMENFGDKVRLIWKDYPEREFSSPSFQAALAARCAGEQNEFWPYHDLLFNKNGDFSKEIFIDLAKKLKLKLDEFKKCLGDNNIGSLIQNNIEEADALNITGVPFIYVNDEEIMGEVSYEELKKIVESELKK
jgi:protein-disulfide isomerase